MAVEKTVSTGSTRARTKRRAKQSAPRRPLPVDDLALLIEENPNPVLRAQTDGTLLYANPSGAALLQTLGWRTGRKLPAVLRKQVFSDTPIDHTEFDFEVGNRVYSVVASAGAENRIVNLFFHEVTSRQDAEDTLHRLNADMEQSEGEQTTKLARANEQLRVEIDHRRKVQAALAEINEDWERIFNTVPDLIAILDRKHRIVQVNRTMARALDVQPEQCIGLSCFQCVHGTDHPPESCPHAQTLADGCEHTAELYEERLGGNFLVTTTPMFNAEGELIGSVHVARDITERKQAEARIADLARFPEENPNPVLRARADGTLLYANEAARAMLQTMGWRTGRKLPSVLRKHVTRAVSTDAQSEADIDVGDQVYSVAFSAGVGQTDVNMYVRDVTDSKQAEEALRASQTDLAHAQAVGQIGSWRLDVRQNVLTWSDENHRIFGIPKGTPMTYETFLSTVHPDDREYVDTKWNAGLRGEPYDIEHRIVVNGVVRWVREKAYLEFDNDGTLLGGFGITQNITDRKYAEEALKSLNETLEQRIDERTAVAEQRAELLTRLAAELSQVEHRERNRLASILHDDLQQLLLAARLRLAGISTHGIQFRTELEPIDQLLDECLSTARDLATELSPPILHRGTLGEAIEWLSGWFVEKYGLSVVIDVSKDLPTTHEHVRILLFQAVRELLSNAVKHSGTMEASILLSSENDSLMVRVEDRGSGFDAEAVQQKLDRAHSFGLLNIRERLEAFGGRLEFESTPTGGARFQLLVPMEAAREEE